MQRLDIQKLRSFVESKSGKLVSNEYDAAFKVECQCEKGHIWTTCWSNLRSGRWCPKCRKNVPDISTLQQYARNKKGLLLSVEYINNRTKMLWQCEKGHTWYAKWNDINTGYWCPHCAHNIKTDISILQNHARKFNGRLISIEYVNKDTPLTWECSNKHTWNACWASISRMNTWCPECSSFKTEKLCKTLLEKYLGIPFKKTNFNYNNKRYQFDGYNKEYNIAFEYHGIQHFEYPNYWHKTKEIHLNAKQNDRNKELYCKENNIKLIIIPYYIKDIETYIKGLVDEL